MSTFASYGLDDKLVQAISEMGFVTPTPIQAQTIPGILGSEQDIIAISQTGTGKTAAFGLPVLQRLSLETQSVQAIVLCPTRELCLQISKDLISYSKHMPRISTVAVYGGTPIDAQIRSLRKGAQIVVGTPGRTLDLINRGMLKINDVRWVVLDEADEMLNMGFREDLDMILETTPKEKQTLLFSATMPEGIRRIARNYMNKPLEISSGQKNTGADTVEHFYYVVRATQRYEVLKRLADINPDIYGIVFCRTRRETQEVASKLIHDGYNADALHGDLSQAQRDTVMQRFRIRQLQLLVATDVAARGLDINELTHVINYNLPDDPEVYVHRSGRTGRAGNTGISMTIAHSRETNRIRDIERLVGKKFQQKRVPSGTEICEKRLYNLMDNFEKVEIDETQIAPFLEAIYKKLAWLDRDELIKRVVSVEFSRFLEYYKDAEDLNTSSSSSSRSDDPRSSKRSRENKVAYSRFYINMGAKHNMNASKLIGIINDHTGTRSIGIGKIDIQRNFSFFEVEAAYEGDVLKSFNNSRYEDVALNVQLSEPDKNAEKRSNNNYDDRGGDRGGRSGGGNRYSDSSRGGGNRRKKPTKRW